MSALGETRARPFELRIDPRYEGVSAADLDEQYELASEIRDQTSRANNAVITIHEIHSQLEMRLEDNDNAALAGSAERLLEGMGAIEEELYQVRNQSGQDPLNFPIKLNNRLASLRRSVENGDARPTAGAYKVFEELSAELDGHMEALHALLAALNRALVDAGLEAIE